MGDASSPNPMQETKPLLDPHIRPSREELGRLTPTLSTGSTTSPLETAVMDALPA